jgi:hypothetical protein
VVAHPGLGTAGKNIVLPNFITADHIVMQHIRKSAAIVGMHNLNILFQAILNGIRHDLLTPLAGDNLTDIPQVNNCPLGFGLLLIVIVFHENGVGAAVTAFHLDIPSAFMHDNACAAANGAAFQF